MADYDHSQTRLRLMDAPSTARLSPLREWLHNANPLEQQAQLQKETLRHRPSRARRYTRQRVFAVGNNPNPEAPVAVANAKSVPDGLMLAASSFLSGCLFAGFLSFPVGCVTHAVRGANMRSKTLFPDMVMSGVKASVRNGLAYGVMLATFRGVNYALSSLHDDGQQTVTTITSSGALGCAVGAIVFAGGLQRPLLVAAATAAGASAFFGAGRYVVEGEHDARRAEEIWGEAAAAAATTTAAAEA